MRGGCIENGKVGDDHWSELLELYTPYWSFVDHCCQFSPRFSRWFLFFRNDGQNSEKTSAKNNGFKIYSTIADKRESQKQFFKQIFFTTLHEQKQLLYCSFTAKKMCLFHLFAVIMATLVLTFLREYVDTLLGENCNSVQILICNYCPGKKILECVMGNSIWHPLNTVRNAHAHTEGKEECFTKS